MVDIKIDIAPEIAERTRLSKNDKKEFRSSGREFWRVGFGQYETFYLDDHDSAQRKNEEELKGAEIILAQQVREFAKKGSDKQIVILDFGGMYSLSFLRIAGSPGIRELVTSGKATFVVTNLEFTVDEGIKTAGQGNNDITKEELELVDKNKNLVTYIQSDAAELRTKKIRNAFTGKEINLAGNIDLIHERMALAHGLKNDIDFYLLAKCLNDRGILFIGSERLHSRSLNDSPEMVSLREQTLKLGFSNLKKAGLIEINPIRATEYRIFSKPGAPVVKM